MPRTFSATDPSPLTSGIQVVSEPPPPPEQNPDAPTFISGGLRLNARQLDRITTRLTRRIQEVRDEMGIDIGGTTLVNGWAWERQRNQMQYDNDWFWRRSLGGIFEYSNFSLNISKRYARLMAAKTSDTLVGTDPFFSAMPTEHGNPQLAKQAEWFIQEKISQSNCKRRIKEAQRTALIRNEAVVKLSYQFGQTNFYGPAVVAVGPFAYETPDGVAEFQKGDPIITPKGDYIYQKDDIFEDPDVQGLFHLEKEPTVAFRHQYTFAYFADLQQSLKGPEGLDVRTLDYRDFLCPLKYQTIHEADMNVHLFDEQWEKLRAQYGKFPISKEYFSQVPPGFNAPVSGEKYPKLEKGEVEDGSRVLNMVNAADAYIRLNVYEGEPEDIGQESELWIVMDTRYNKIIWADYLANHMPRRPFEVIPGVELVQNRWYGIGVFSMLEHKQLYVDTQFNRVNFKSSKSSSVRFRIKDAVSQWKAGEKIVIGDDKILDVEDPRFDSRNPPLFQVNLTDIDPEAMRLIEMMMQAGATEVGIVGPNDAGMSGMDTTKLAEGIKSMERTGNLLMKFTEADHADGISAVLDQAVDIILENMDQDEVVYRSDTSELIKLNRDAVRRMKKSVKMLLTKSRSTETIETARMVIQLIREYYEALNPFEQYKVRDEYVRQLKALEVPDADERLDEVSKEAAYAWLQQSKQPPTIPPKTSIATKFVDLERPEQEQVLKREGIEPAPTGPVTTHQSQQIVQSRVEAQDKEKAKAANQPDRAEELKMDKAEHAQEMRHNEEKHQQDMRHSKEQAKAKPATAKK